MASDVVKKLTGMSLAQQSGIRVQIKRGSSDAPSAFARVSTSATTWEECFAEIFPNTSISKVHCLTGGVLVPLETPGMLSSEDVIVVQFYELLVGGVEEESIT